MKFRHRFANPILLSFGHDREQEHEIEQFYGNIVRHTVPVVTGAAFVAVPYLTGAAIVAFAPPWMKPVGVAMLIPNPVADAVYFAAGYTAGNWLVEDHPMFDWMD